MPVPHRPLTFRLLALCLLCALAAAAEDWPRFRGPNGVGVSPATNLPERFGPETNVVWKTALPQGHSSPVIAGGRIFLTGSEGGVLSELARLKVTDKGGTLSTIAIDPANGEILWKKQAPRPRYERYQPTNSAASPSPVTDGENVYVFFGDFGLLSYTRDGEERWRVPLGPFNNVNGHGSSPVLVGDLVILACDQDTGSYLLALDKDTGKTRWRTERPETTRAYVTPAVYQPDQGPAQLIVPGAYFIASYSVETGEKIWWILNGGWQPKSTPIIDGDRIFFNSWEGGGGRPGKDFPNFAAAVQMGDKNSNDRIEESELPATGVKTNFINSDLNENGSLEEREWTFLVARMTSRSSLIAVEDPGQGDLTGTDAVTWTLEKFLPNVPSPLLYEGVLYLVKDGGIFTSLDASTGAIHKQGRLPDALDKYYASPVVADGKIYLMDQTGRATVVQAGAQWSILASNDLADEVYATPAFASGRIYLRTRNTLYCFGRDLQ